MQALLVVALVASALALTDIEQWDQFKTTYGKTYAMGSDAYRFTVFQQNLRTAEELQKGNPEAVFGVTKFSDLTPAEFQAMYTGLNMTEHGNWHRSLPQVAHETSKRANVDWRGTRSTAPKDQGQCGSCWAFSAAEAAEACTAMKGKLTPLSAQQIVDCCTTGGSNGCNGGFPDQCLRTFMGKAIATEASYPYVTKKSTCKTTFTVGLPANSCTYKGLSGSESATSAALATNPVSICVDATPLQSYNSGIISGATCKKTNVDHAILLVAETDTYYVVKNSWGAGWGEAGYFRMAKGVNCLSFTTENSLVF